MSHTIDPNTVATMQGRELDAAIAHWLFRRPSVYAWPNATFPFADIPAYSTDPAAFFAMVEAVRAKGWTSIDMHVSYIDGEAFWTVKISCGRGPCELHGNPHDNWHGVEAEGSTLPLAFARAAVSACLSDTNQKGG